MSIQNKGSLLRGTPRGGPLTSLRFANSRRTPRGDEFEAKRARSHKHFHRQQESAGPRKHHTDDLLHGVSRKRRSRCTNHLVLPDCHPHGEGRVSAPGGCHILCIWLQIWLPLNTSTWVHDSSYNHHHSAPTSRCRSITLDDVRDMRDTPCVSCWHDLTPARAIASLHSFGLWSASLCSRSERWCSTATSTTSSARTRPLRSPLPRSCLVGGKGDRFSL